MGPLLLLDIDGPLNPWAAVPGARPPGYVEHSFPVSRWRRRRLRVWLNPRHGPALLDLAARTGAELAWATSWGHRANALVGPAIGLPRLPVVEFAGPRSDTESSWKYPAVARFAYGRSLAWLDDDFGLYPEAREAFLSRREASGSRTLLVTVDPEVGLTAKDLRAVEVWLGYL
jgi:hypothetical protein